MRTRRLAMKSEEKRQQAIDMLRQRAEELGCLPKKSDFPKEDAQRIKSYLGPWPRALETAGLKPKKIPAESRRKAAGHDLEPAGPPV